MSDAATRQDIDKVIDIIRDFMKQVDDRLNTAESKLDLFKDQVATSFAKQDSKYDHLINTIDGFIGRIVRF